MADLDRRAVFVEADLLSGTYTSTSGARSLDIRHVAAALILRANQFASFGRGQRSLAVRTGLIVLTRNKPS